MVGMEQQSSRTEQFAQLRELQDRDLSSLRSRLTELHADIAAAEIAALHASIFASAARELIGQRGGAVPAPASTRSRARPKQRLWALKYGSCTRHEEKKVPLEPGMEAGGDGRGDAEISRREGCYCCATG